MSSNTDQTQTNATAPEGGDSNFAEAAAHANEPKAAEAPVFEEKTISIDDLQDEAEYSEAEFNELFELYENTLTDFVEGELVVGKILAVNDKEVAVDIGFKSEGVIPIDEFLHRDQIIVGDDIEVFLDNVEDSDGQLVLSKKKADFLRVWEKIIDSHDNDETLNGICSRRIKGGIVVDLMGVDAFLPGSQIDVRPIRDFDALIGREMEFKIVKVNEARKNIVVSHRVLVEEGMKEQRQKILDNLEKGQILEGSVKNITDFGVFIDLGGVDGLLHINDLSWGRVSHPSEIVSLDEKINIQILDFNEPKDRISLGLKQLQPHPWDSIRDKHKEGDIIKGKVVNIADYGSFIELEKGVEGLIHISEMSWTQHIKHPSKILSLGEVIDAKILNIDHEGRKISLGLKQLEPDPWDGIEAKYPVGSRQKGIVRNLTNFGAFIELEEGVDGLVHISDLSWTKKIRHPGEVVKKGDDVEVMVLNIEQGNRRISLGYKQTMDNPWDTFEDTYSPKTPTTGKIVRMIEKGVIVELPETVDGFVPMSQLSKEGIKKPADAYQVGDEIRLLVIEFNKESKKIILSEKQISDDAPALEPGDQDAIAEFEKEVGGRAPASIKKAKAKTKAEPEAKAATKVDAPAESSSDAAETEAVATAEEVAEVAEKATEAAEETTEAAEEATEATEATEAAEEAVEAADETVEAAEEAVSDATESANTDESDDSAEKNAEGESEPKSK